MSKQVQKEKQDTKAEVVAADELTAKDQQPLTDAIDDILDEIDGVLEENAEAFVAGFIQKGGE